MVGRNWYEQVARPFAHRGPLIFTDPEDFILEGFGKCRADLFGGEGERHGQQQRKFILTERFVPFGAAAQRDIDQLIVQLFFDAKGCEQRVVCAIAAKGVVQRFHQRLGNRDPLLGKPLFNDHRQKAAF